MGGYQCGHLQTVFIKESLFDLMHVFIFSLYSTGRLLFMVVKTKNQGDFIFAIFIVGNSK
jgi:hypothetical protein